MQKAHSWKRQRPFKDQRRDDEDDDDDDDMTVIIIIIITVNLYSAFL